MSEQSPETAGGETAGQSLTPEQEAFLREQQARQAAAEAEQRSPADAQAAVAEAMSERGPQLPAEKQIEELMAALKKQSEQIESLGGQVQVMQKQQEEQQAAHGGPIVVRYANAARDKAAALAIANPDLGADHFTALTEATSDLADQALQVSKGQLSPSVLNGIADKVERFVSRTHRRLSSKHVDFSALADDVENVVDEALRLAS